LALRHLLLPAGGRIPDVQPGGGAVSGQRGLASGERARFSEQTEHVYGECQYRTRKSWPWKRRVIYKAEVVRAEGKKPKDNPRFVVTNMKQSPQWLYQEVYCQRGDLENRIKELHYGMEIGRTSCTSFWANQFRVLMTAAA
jgi:Transposase DDE domain group 1